MERTQYIVGNWKMYKTSREAVGYLEALEPLVAKCKANIYLAVPYTAISSAARYAKNTNMIIGAQNMNDAREGPFTGEIAALMLKEAGAQFVLLGHSERRKLFGETDEFVCKKVARALADELAPILCIGEDLQERESGRMEEVLRGQILTSLQGIPEEEAEKLILAYEPVWAIGTGKSATPKMAQEAHSFCRSILSERFGKRKGDQISILYGGSVKGDNAASLAAQADIDGVLVGGASLTPETFAEIAKNCEKHS